MIDKLSMQKNVDYVVEFVESRVVLKFHHLSVDDEANAEVIVFHRDQSGKKRTIATFTF